MDFHQWLRAVEDLSTQIGKANVAPTGDDKVRGFDNGLVFGFIGNFRPTQNNGHLRRDGFEHGDDFASTIGTGGVVGTKFVWPDAGPKFKNVNLTQQKEEHWKKWIAIYNEKMLSKGTFLPLYTFGYDMPEAYAIQKDGKMYYAFFAPKEDMPWKGQVELRGLTPGTYHVVDYADDKDLGTVQVTANQTAKLKTEFKQHLLLEVSSQ